MIEEWNVFRRRWEVFKSGSGINDASAPSQFFQCAGPELGDSLLKANANAASENLTELLAAMRSLAIIPVATCVLRTELLQLRQERDEPFRTFTAKVRGKAETCSYTTSCTCGASVDYTEHIIRDVILNGLYDSDISREVLGIAGILEKPVNEVIALVETKEMARNALPTPSLSAVSSFAKQKTSPPNHAPTPSQADRAKEATCPGCHITFKIFTEGARGCNEKPHQMCIECYRANRRKKRRQRQPQQRPPQAPGVHATENRAIFTDSSPPNQECRTPSSLPTTSPHPEGDHTRHRHQTIRSAIRSPYLLQGGVEKGSFERSSSVPDHHIPLPTRRGRQWHLQHLLRHPR